jgi:phage replication-related protein YjqB (UPF0714/DUF867 family)
MPFTVSKALSAQSTLIGSRQYCSISRELADRLGARAGIQLRIRSRATGEVGAYTVHEVRADDADLRLAKAARDPIGATPGTEVDLRTTVPRADLQFEDAWRSGDVVETVWHDPDADPEVVFCAPHGGDLERNTDQSAAFAARAFGLDRCSAWMVHNFGADTLDRWHVTSSAISPASYPGLGRLVGTEPSVAVSFHLWNGDELVVGGRAPADVREDLAEVIADAVNETREVVTEGAKYMGDTEANFVNWLPAGKRGGIQLESPAYICQRYRKRLGEAVASFVESREW